MHLSPQEKQIIDLLSDGEWHCPTKELFMKDDRARISALLKKGYQIVSDRYCDGSCGMRHNARVKLRRLVSMPESVDSLVKRQLEWARQLPEQRPAI